MNLSLIIPDLHIPFHDTRAVGIVNQVMEALQPDRVVQIGDMTDCYLSSIFEQDPDHAMSVEDECDLAYDMWEEWREIVPNATLVWEEGNHETRWERQRRRKGVKRRSLRDIPTLMQQSTETRNKTNLGVRWIQLEKQPYKCGRYHLLHGSMVRQQSGYTARAHLLQYGVNLAHGHTHRIGTHSFTRKADGANVTAYELGCLCQLEAEYIKSGHPNWQLGFALIYHYRTHDEMKVYQIHKSKGRYYVTVAGELYHD